MKLGRWSSVQSRGQSAFLAQDTLRRVNPIDSRTQSRYPRYLRRGPIPPLLSCWSTRSGSQHRYAMVGNTRARKNDGNAQSAQFHFAEQSQPSQKQDETDPAKKIGQTPMWKKLSPDEQTSGEGLGRERERERGYVRHWIAYMYGRF